MMADQRPGFRSSPNFAPRSEGAKEVSPMPQSLSQLYVRSAWIVPPLQGSGVDGGSADPGLRSAAAIGGPSAWALLFRPFGAHLPTPQDSALTAGWRRAKPCFLCAKRVAESQNYVLRQTTKIPIGRDAVGILHATLKIFGDLRVPDHPPGNHGAPHPRTGRSTARWTAAAPFGEAGRRAVRPRAESLRGCAGRHS